MAEEEPSPLDAARAAAEQAYAPYSHFRVGAAVVGESGRLYTGANVENAAFPSSVCAEANAMTTAVAAGERHLRAVYVVCLDGEGSFPCGNCRQIMEEFGVETVVVAGADPAEYRLEELLPHAFGPESL